ncbi:MAG: Hsp20/alpha crystallin family protein [Bdellovibrionales bacterium]|nr:Hsp20/alpha crystallin family protein [Bdellovibrionales bacterium]
MKFRDLVPLHLSGSQIPVRRLSSPSTLFGGDIDRLLENFFQGFPTQNFTSAEQSFEAFSPNVNVEETPEAYTVTCEVPGLEEKDLDLSVENDSLILSGEKRYEKKEEGKGKSYYYESSFGSFRRVIPLAAEVDHDAIDASLQKGVLTIHLPKVEPAKAGKRVISVRAN